MKHFCILFLILLLYVPVWGQESAALDKITLSTGEVYIGQIEVKTADMVMIKTQDGTRYQFQLAEVKQLGKVNANELSKAQSAKVLTVGQTNGNFSGQLEVAGAITSARFAFSSSPNAQVSLTFGSKKAFGKNVFLGLGVGYNSTFFSTGSTALVLIPVFARIQSKLTNDKTAPFIGIDAGYAFASSNNFKGGTLVKLSFGISHKINEKTALIAGLFGGLNQINTKLTETNDLGTFTYTGNTSMLSYGLKLGVQF
jgi:hypothetical protein